MASFLLLAFAFTWPLQLAVLNDVVTGPAALACLGVAGLGPSLAALVVTNGRVLRRLRERPRLGPALLALFAANLMVLLAVLVGMALGGPPPVLALPFLGALLVPPLGEELGWRGWLYPRLAERHGPLAGGLMTGAVWAIWHLPTAISDDATVTLLYLLGIIAVSVPIAWLMERSGRNPWIGVLAHLGINGVVLVRDLDGRAVLLRSAVFALAALLAGHSLSLGRRSE
jgi:uncharacterized protein